MAGPKNRRRQRHRRRGTGILRRQILRFHRRRTPVVSVIALLAGIVCLAGLVMLVIWSAQAAGAADLSIGYMGVTALLVSLLGFAFSLSCFHRPNTLMAVPYAGAIVNGLAFIVYFAIYAYGFIETYLL